MRVKDYFLTEEEFELREFSPGILRTHPVPEDLSLYYDSKKYISHHQEERTLKNWFYKALQKINLRYKKSILKKNAKKFSKILDYGCGSGAFLDYIKGDYFVLGFEPHHLARGVSQKKLGEDRMISDLDQISDESLDVVSLWHVLEHVENYEHTLHVLYKKLKPGGRIILAVPNHRSYDAGFYKNFWAAYDVPRHLFHFSVEGISSIFNHEQWRLDKIYPMYLDSFYVCMLSERYKGSKLSLVKGVFRGFLSNLKAMSSGEFSSLIFCVQKK